MAVVGRRVSVGTSATKLNSADGDSVAGSSLLIHNKDASVSVFLGGAEVTATGGSVGCELEAAAAVPADISAGDNLYAIAASGTVRVDVLETGI